MNYKLHLPEQSVLGVTSRWNELPLTGLLRMVLLGKEVSHIGVVHFSKLQPGDKVHVSPINAMIQIDSFEEIDGLHVVVRCYDSEGNRLASLNDLVSLVRDFYQGSYTPSPKFKASAAMPELAMEMIIDDSQESSLKLALSILNDSSSVAIARSGSGLGVCDVTRSADGHFHVTPKGQSTLLYGTDDSVVSAVKHGHFSAVAAR